MCHLNGKNNLHTQYYYATSKSSLCVQVKARTKPSRRQKKEMRARREVSLFKTLLKKGSHSIIGTKYLVIRDLGEE